MFSIEILKLYIEDIDYDYKSFNGYLSFLIEKNDDIVENKEIKTFYLNGTNYESNMEVDYQSIDKMKAKEDEEDAEVVNNIKKVCLYLSLSLFLVG